MWEAIPGYIVPFTLAHLFCALSEVVALERLAGCAYSAFRIQLFSRSVNVYGLLCLLSAALASTYSDQAASIANEVVHYSSHGAHLIAMGQKWRLERSMWCSIASSALCFLNFLVGNLIDQAK